MMYVNMKQMIGLLALCVCLVFASSVSATTYYAGQPANDSNCTMAQNRSQPRRGIGNGISCLSAGDTLVILGGTYNEVIWDTIPSGSPGNPTIVKADVPGLTILQPTNAPSLIVSLGFNGPDHDIVVDGLVLDGSNTGCSIAALRITGANGATNLTISNNEIRNLKGCQQGASTAFALYYSAEIETQGTGIVYRGNKIHDIGLGDVIGQPAFGYGFYMAGANLLVENNEIWNTSGYPLHGYSNKIGGLVSNNIVRNNFFHDSGGPVLVCHRNNQIYNNVIARVAMGPAFQRGALVVGDGCSGEPSGNNQIYNNTIYGSGKGTEPGGECIKLLNTNNNTVRNNICYQNFSNDLFVNATSGVTTFGGNVCDTNAANCQFVGNPGFVSSTFTTAQDFKLAAGAFAIDKGLSTGPATKDYGGATRVAPYDVGAWEFSGAPPQAPAVYYVRTGGNDSRDCATATNSATPVQSITKGLTCMTVPGSTLDIGAGTFPVAAAINTQLQTLVGGASWAQPTTVRGVQGTTIIQLSASAPSGTPVFGLVHPTTDTFMIFDGLVIDANNVLNSDAFYISPSAHDIRIRNTTMKNALDAAVLIDGGRAYEIAQSTVSNGNLGIRARGTVDGLLIQGNTIQTLGGKGIWLDGASQSGAITNTTIIQNVLKSIGAAASACAIDVIGPNTSTGLIANNAVYGNFCGVVLRTGTSSFNVYNNTVYQMTQNGIQIESGVNGVSVIDNIVQASSGSAVVDNGTATVFAANMCSSASVGCVLVSNASFTDAAGGNFDLAQGSSGIDAGICLSQVTNDILSRSRPFGSTCDMGAYETRNAAALPQQAVTQRVPYPFISTGFSGYR